MEQTRLEKVEAEERRREEAEIRRQKYIKEVEQQVREKEMSDLLEAEKFEEESRMVKKAFIALQKEDEQKAIERTKLKHKLRDEFLKTSEEAEYFKKIKEQEDKFTEMRVSRKKIIFVNFFSFFFFLGNFCLFRRWKRITLFSCTHYFQS